MSRTARTPLVTGLALLITSVLLQAPLVAAAKNAAAKNAATVARTVRDVKYLSSDELEGRGVGLKGLDKAADYVRQQFKQAGVDVSPVDGDAFQKFTMTTGVKRGKTNTLQFVGPDGKTIPLKLDADFQTCSFGGTAEIDAEMVFVGYAIEDEKLKFDELTGIDLKDKIAVVMRRVPKQGVKDGPFAGGHGGISSHAELRTKMANVFGAGAKAIIFVNDEFSGKQAIERMKSSLHKAEQDFEKAEKVLAEIDSGDSETKAEAEKKVESAQKRVKRVAEMVKTTETDQLMAFDYGRAGNPRKEAAYHVKRAAMDRVLKSALGTTLAEIEAGIDEDFKPRSALLRGWRAKGATTVDRIRTEVKNVIAVIEGAGPLADETVVIGAHYDHVGRGGQGSLALGSKEIHNGADDNASGTVSLIELARRLQAREEKLARRVVFIAFTAEERGLIGSARYVKEPVFPLEKTVAMFNMDMVGRLTNEKLTVYGTGTAKNFDGAIDKLGAKYGFHIVKKPEGFGPSDHSSFYAKEIPVLHFFTGTHSDYHRPGDDWEKLNVDGMARIISLIEDVVISTANAPERPEYVKVKGRAQLQRSGSRPYFGSQPDFGSEVEGYALGGVSGGSPAEKGGLKGGDVIIQLGKNKVANLSDFDLALRKFSAGEEVKVTVLRDGEKVELTVILDKPR